MEQVEDAKKWHRSTFCADVNCVEIADDGDRVLMRDSKDTSQPFLGFHRDVFAMFLTDIENGRFDNL
jgi:hypothetical protein